MNELEELAELIFPDINYGIEYLEKKYPERNLNPEAIVTRFAPSPTGFLHTGSLFTALIASKACKDTNGVFYLRIEDTDQKREIEGSKDLVVNELAKFNIIPDEGYLAANREKGIYGPYIQSLRGDIYKAVIKDMIKMGIAYPCFCKEEELNATRTMQIEKKERTGYYGQYAKCRNLDIKEAKKKIIDKCPYVIRFKSQGSHQSHYHFKDLVRGEISLTQNDLDIIILKSDGLPTYHFAHVVDDHFMHSTHIVRGEEWLSSLPIHLEMFRSLGFKAPKYAHLPAIMKVDENNKRRKLSKRYDLEAAVSYFYENGYPVEAVIDYLMTIANSNFEAWRSSNPLQDISAFEFKFKNMCVDGAIFDLEKIKNIAKNYLSRLSAQTITEKAYDYACQYNPTLKEYIDNDKDYFVQIMAIERDKPSPRKDYEKYSDIPLIIDFFYKYSINLEICDTYDKELIKGVLESFIPFANISCSEEDWLKEIKDEAYKLGFAKNNKELMANPKLKYVFSVYMEIVRVAITTKKNSPNLYYCCKILKEKEIIVRIKKYLAMI